MTDKHQAQQKKSIVFVDLDGTLWLNEQIPDSALTAIQKARENGHLIFANTGRSRDSAWRALEGLPLSGAVYSLGSEIWLNGKRIFFEPLGSERTHRLLETLKSLDIGISVEGSQSTFANAKAKDDLLASMPAIQDAAFRFDLLPALEEMNEEDYAGAMKLSLIDVEKSTLEPLLKQEGMAFTPFGKPERDGRVDGEIALSHMTKGTAFETIQSILKTPWRTIALGDSENDLSMFAEADLSIAMGNGTPAALEAADHITAAIEDDGLYQAFAWAGLLDEPSGVQNNDGRSARRTV